MSPRGELITRNRAAILAAAHHVFSTVGVQAPLELIVEASGVGRGTLYRHFADRTALLVALFDAEVERIMNGLAPHPVERQIEVFLTHVATNGERSPALSEAWRALPPDHVEMRASRERLKDLLKRPLQAAIDTGRLRATTTPDTLILVARMIGAGVRAPVADGKLEQTALAVVLHGLLASPS
uniref:Transcriptional regulator, TetR family n=1 Tax=Caulobacter sp. (strain K31) TaxID=366602 RepID=B0T9Y7_CAUSK